MGIWDVFYSAADKMKQHSPDLAPVKNVVDKTHNAVSDDGPQKVKEYWDVFYSAADRMKQHSPDLTSVKDAVGKTYKAVRDDGPQKLKEYWDVLYFAADKMKQHSSDLTPVKNGIGKTCNAVRYDGPQKLKQCWDDPRCQEMVKRFGTDVVVPYFFSVAGIPGAKHLPKIAQVVWKDKPPSSVHDSKKKNEIMQELHKSITEPEHTDRFVPPNYEFYLQTEAVQMPEEVIQQFIKNGFKGHDFFDYLIVPKHRNGKKP